MFDVFKISSSVTGIQHSVLDYNFFFFFINITCRSTEQDRIPVMRGQWFIDGTWLPLEEDESDLIEQEHLLCFRGQQMRDTYEIEAVTTTVDSKDGREFKTDRKDREMPLCVRQRR